MHWIPIFFALAPLPIRLDVLEELRLININNWDFLERFEVPFLGGLVLPQCASLRTLEVSGKDLSNKAMFSLAVSFSGHLAETVRRRRSGPLNRVIVTSTSLQVFFAPEVALALVRSFGVLPVRAVQLGFRVWSGTRNRDEVTIARLQRAAAEARRRNPALESIHVSVLDSN
eukprot:tig00021037_g17421.t1